jgi:cytochrome c
MLAAGLGVGTGEAADVKKGEAAFVRQCAICHTINKGGDDRVGPNLFGVIGRHAGSVQGFKYTNAFRNTANFEWSEGLLGPWISLPAVMVPGTAMGVFPGVSDRDKDDIVAYVAAQK